MNILLIILGCIAWLSALMFLVVKLSKPHSLQEFYGELRSKRTDEGLRGIIEKWELYDMKHLIGVLAELKRRELEKK